MSNHRRGRPRRGRAHLSSYPQQVVEGRLGAAAVVFVLGSREGVDMERAMMGRKGIGTSRNLTCLMSHCHGYWGKMLLSGMVGSEDALDYLHTYSNKRS